VTEWPVYKLH